jgi:hypothetical protein
MTAIALPALGQQQTGGQQQMAPSPATQTNKDADKGVKTRNSGESGYVGDQEKPGSSDRPPGRPDATTGATTPGTPEKSR